MDPPVPLPARDPGFEAALADRPADGLVRSIYADWLEDRGEDSYAAAQRYLVHINKHPLECDVEMDDHGPSPRVAFFGHPYSRPVATRFGPALLPRRLFERLRARAKPIEETSTLWDETFRSLARGWYRSITESYWVYFPSPQVAVEELAEALAAEVGDGAG